ncbi:DUF4350 domain-containing protein [Erythrobacter sp. JK5]|uniref:DUF4350 domain-containing protein n=1 Tax=Erythrobacter sp. JK5 TaxID=2829500 RepID=UPI001BA48D3D|nr:DUF4350 domain-containing protein [Erythrobacter sp. JK5]QUL37782.1 DUF4350 domain-containing protein [Erythrobacter sp. JK5]
MSAAAGSGRGSGPFGRGAVLGMVLIGFVAFVAMLYFLSIGDTGRRDNDGAAHAASNALNGYSGLAKLLEANGYEVSRSRLQSGLDTPDLLVITPPPYFEAEELTDILRRRAYVGPTMVIVPKWLALGLPQDLPEEVRAKVKDGWVQLGDAYVPEWLGELEGRYAFSAELTTDETPTWAGFGNGGTLPHPRVIGANPDTDHTALVVDGAARRLAVSLPVEDEMGYGDDTEWVTFVLEPDLVNNYGLADKERAALALKLVEDAGYGDSYPVTFDLTLNGFGGSINLLTLAFRPPFLAATLCLILAILIVGWRAFQRFGPPVAHGPAIAFGKSRLVRNGAALIVRAGRLRLLAEPYAALSARRLAEALGLTRHDPEAIDKALAVRLPNDEPYSRRAARLRDARTPMEILRAAQALKELEGKLHR